MNLKKLFLLLLGTMVFGLVSGRATVNESNSSTTHIKKVIMRSTITCGAYNYYTTFTCEHYLHCGESMTFVDGSDGGCDFGYSVDSITWIPCPPTISVSGPTTAGVCQSVTFTASVNHASGLTISWSGGSGSGSGTSFTTSWCSPGTYTVTATLSNGTSDSKSITVQCAGN